MMLEAINLSFDYPDKPLLRDVELSVNPGTLMHLCGRNGSGKTTMLKLLAGILPPLGGDIRFRGRVIHNDLSAYQQNIRYIGHKTGISPLLTARENCKFELHLNPNKQTFDALIARFSLEGLVDMPCYLLSVGQRRRVGLMRLLLSEAPVWFLDEPLVALDQEAISNLMLVMDEHLSRGGVIVLTSHQPLSMPQGNYKAYTL